MTPWERYGAQPAPAPAGAGPWAKYAAPAAAPSAPEQTEEPESWREWARGMAGEITAGATLNYGDELKAWLQSKLGNGTYEDQKAQIDAEAEQFRERHPVQALAANVVGGAAVPGMGLAGAGGRGLLAATAANAAVGGVTGAVAGSGTGEGVEGRLRGAAAGGALGTVLGGAAPAVSRVVGAVARPVAAAFFDKAGEHQARRALQGALEGADAASLANTMRQAQADNIPMTLGEAGGQQAVDLMESAAQTPGPGRAAIVKQIGDRQKGQSQRIVDSLADKSGVGVGSLDKKLATAEARRAAASVNYGNLASADTPDNVMANIRLMLASKAGPAAYRRALSIADQARVRGEPGGFLPSLHDVLNGQKLSAGEADQVLQGLEAFAEKKMTPGLTPGMKTDTGESYPFNETARWLRKQMQEHIPEFAKARAEYAGPSELIKAVDQGDRMTGMDLDTFKTLWSKASAAQQEGYRIGMINGLKADLERFKTGITADAAGPIAGRKAFREKLRFVLGAEADDFLRGLDTEALTSQNAAQILGGPASARRMAAKDALGEAIPASTAGWVTRLIGKLDELAQRKTRAAIARFSLTTDPDEAERLAVELLTRREPLRAAGRAALIGTTAAVPAAMEDRR